MGKLDEQLIRAVVECKLAEATKLIDQGICLIAHTLPQSKLEDLLANTKDSKSLVVIKPLYQFGGNDI